ncbi:MAG: V-type ATP synthase subunit E [Rubrobacter sp.]
MPLKDLLNAIEAEADGEGARLRTESGAEAEAILSGAREEASRAREETLGAHASATRGEADRRISLARLEAGRIERTAREQAYALLLAEALAALAAAREEPGYPDTLGALLAEALAALPDAATAHVNPGDEGLTRDLARAMAPGLVVAPDADVGGGVVLESAGGRVVRNTMEERLANAGPGLRPWYGRRIGALAGSGGAGFR